MVGKREKRGGRSAWTLCSGLPLWIARQKRRAIPVCESYSVLYCAAPAVRSLCVNPTLSSTARHPPREARPCAPATHSPLLPSPYSLLNGSTLLFFKGRGKRGEGEVRGHFAVGFRYGSHGRSAVRGALKRASHALPSPPFSLLSTSYFHHSQFPRMTIQYMPCRASPVACSASNARK